MSSVNVNTVRNSVFGIPITALTEIRLTRKLYVSVLYRMEKSLFTVQIVLLEFPDAPISYHLVLLSKIIAGKLLLLFFSSFTTIQLEV